MREALKAVSGHSAIERLALLSDEEIVAQAQARNPLAFQALVHRYEQRLRNFANSQVNDWDLACDITQESFIRVDKHIAVFDTSKKFSTWIYIICSNLCKNALRNRSRHKVVTMSDLQAHSNPGRPMQFVDAERNRPDYLMEQRDLGLALEVALSELDWKDRRILLLREIQDLSYDEISLKMGLPLGTVKSRINRARNNLKARVEPWI